MFSADWDMSFIHRSEFVRHHRLTHHLRTRTMVAFFFKLTNGFISSIFVCLIVRIFGTFEQFIAKKVFFKPKPWQARNLTHQQRGAVVTLEKLGLIDQRRVSGVSRIASVCRFLNHWLSVRPIRLDAAGALVRARVLCNIHIVGCLGLWGSQMSYQSSWSHNDNTTVYLTYFTSISRNFALHS